MSKVGSSSGSKSSASSSSNRASSSNAKSAAAASGGSKSSSNVSAGSKSRRESRNGGSSKSRSIATDTNDQTRISAEGLAKEKAESHGVNFGAWDDDISADSDVRTSDQAREQATTDAQESREAQKAATQELAESLGEGTMRSGARGESVQSLQSALNDRLGLELEVDGKFGPATRDAVRQFQEQNELDVDGVFGPNTREALLSSSQGRSEKAQGETGHPAEAGQATETGQPNETGQAGEASPQGSQPLDLGDGMLRNGMRGQPVENLQTALNDKLGLSLDTDGRFGPQTRDAVREFQRQNGLQADGVVGDETRQALLGGGGDSQAGETGAATEQGSQTGETGAAAEQGAVEGQNPGQRPETVSFGKILNDEQVGAVHQMVDDLAAKGFKVKADDIINFMAVETGGTFDPAEGAGKGGAVGLAQFTNTAIDAMNGRRPDNDQLDKTRIGEMNFTEQSKVVTEYLTGILEWRGMQGKEVGAGDLYSAVFAPVAVGRNSDYTIYSKGTRAYSGNSSIDTNKDGRITRGELDARLGKWEMLGEDARG